MMEHVDYPHQPGTLYDCPACEAYCYCGDLAREARCIHCGGDLAREARCIHCDN